VNSWVIWTVWGTFALVAVLLGFVGRHFSVRTLRYVTAITGVALVVLITRFGLMHPADPAQASANLANSFTQGADELSAAFFHPLHAGNQVPAPGRTGRRPSSTPPLSATAGGMARPARRETA
jgi:hypothetical protein